MKHQKQDSQREKLSFRSSHENTLLEKYTPHIIIGLTLIGFLLRVYRVGYLSLWVDEYIHAGHAEGVLNGKSIFGDENNGILLTVSIVLSYLIFGVTDFAARLPSVVFGTFLIPLLYYFGKLLFNKQVGILAALLGTISLYEIFWSRMSRNYASFAFPYLLLAIVFYFAFESEKPQTVDSWFTRNSINKKYLIILPFAFVFALLNHQLAVFLIFSVMAYGSILAMWKIMRKEQNRFTNKYAIVLYPTIAAIIFFYLPFMSNVVSPILRLLLPEPAVTWVVPRWDLIGAHLASADAWKSFDTYRNVIQSDFGRYWYVGIVGIIGSFYINKKKALFLACLFLVPFLLMSFIFFDPATPRYILYIYSFYIIYLAVGCYIIIRWLSQRIGSFFHSLRPKAVTVSTAFGVACLILFAPLSDVGALLKTRSHGQVVRRELSIWYFSNWKEASNYVAARLKPGDPLISTMPVATNYYLKRDDSIWFRQMHFDTKLRKYIPNEPLRRKGESAWNYDELVETISLAKRGWLIADYYLYNVMTDPRAREYVIENLKYHFDACTDGTVQVFSWDQDAPEPKKEFLIEVGKTGESSPPMSVTLSSFGPTGIVRLSIDCEGIDSDREAFVVINDAQSFFLPPCRTQGREIVTMDVEKRWFHQGTNTLQFGYYKGNTGDPRRGYAVYNVNVLQG